MEIVLLYLNVLFTPADRSGLYLQSGEAHQKEAQKLPLDLLGEAEVAISLLRHKRGLSGLPASLYPQRRVALRGGPFLSSFGVIRLRMMCISKNMVIN